MFRNLANDMDVARRAFELYEKRGREHGHDLDDWLQAERGLRDAPRSPASDVCQVIGPDEHLLTRVRAAFLEMPDQRLTLQQIQRLCGIERTPCQLTLDVLVETAFLYVSPNGVYTRLPEGADSPRSSPEIADLKTVQRFKKTS
jgi:hypothetical protein